MKDEHGGENQKPRKEERSQGRLITLGYPSERESSRQSDCHAVTYISPMSLCHVCLDYGIDYRIDYRIDYEIDSGIDYGID